MLELARREWPWVDRLPPPQRDVEDAKLKMRYAARYWLTHPRHELALIRQRLEHLYGRAFPIPAGMPLRLTIAGRTFGDAAADAFVRTVADRYLHATLALALVGVPFALRGANPGARILPLTILYFTVLHGVIFFGSPRYQASMIPVLCLLAAVALHRLGGAFRRSGDARRLEPTEQAA
jgi:hypothetical protein